MFPTRYHGFFDEFMPSRQNVYVISDAKYALLQKTEAERQIVILEARAAEYQRSLDTIKSTIDALKQEHDLLEPAAEAPN